MAVEVKEVKYLFNVLSIQHIFCGNEMLTERRNHRKVQSGKDQEKAQSEKDSHSKNQGGKKTN